MGTRWTLSSTLLAAAGVTLILAGLYFILLRPPLLPEDLRFMSVSEEQLGEVGPRLEAWLTQVFRVMGGYVLATGVLATTLAATAYRAHSRGTGVGVLLGGMTSIGLMATVNFTIDSDFKWVLLAMALLWASSLAAYWHEEGRARA